MIHKIDQLSCIGRFRNYQASGDVAFKKLTLFFADNGSGKTTLTAVLRSLTQNKPEIITRRRSTNEPGTPAVKIIQRNAGGDTHYTFNTTGWTRQLTDIEIFDIHFVNENVYSGFEFNDDHKKQLCQFVIGAQGVAIQQQIEQNKNDKTATRQLIELLQQRLIQQVGNNLTADLVSAFLSIKLIDSNNIDQRINKAEAAFQSANANAVIQTLQTPSVLPKISLQINLEVLSLDLKATTKTIQDATLKSLFENHCKDLRTNGIEKPETWLKQGYYFIEVKNGDLQEEKQLAMSCPFCKQTINNTLDIINTYSLQFNKEFNTLVDRIKSYLTALQNFNLRASIENLKGVIAINSAHINSWKSFLPNTVTEPNFHGLDDSATLESTLQILILAIQQKEQNPSIEVSTETVKNFQLYIQKLNADIDSYNRSISIYNASVLSFRSSIQTVTDAQNELYKLRRIKKRFEHGIQSLCTQLSTEKQNLRTLESAYPTLIQQQQQAANSFFSNYKNKINYYLTSVFKTLFKIEDVAHIPPQGRATQSKLGYKLTIDGNDIAFDANQPNSVKDCLSEGDKSTIALAFFLSKLDIDPRLSSKIIVFDDPLSSFDSNRRQYTVQLIKNLLPRVKQIIVLSHNEYFLYEIYKDVAASERKVLRITQNFIAKASVIEALDLNTMVENDYFKHVKELEAFLSHADITKKDIVLGWMRNVLEAHIRFKFYRQTANLSSNQRTLGTLITTLENSGVAFRDNQNRVNILQRMRVINGISCKSHHGEPEPDFALLGTNPNTMSVGELCNFVQDTLNLIDVEL